MFMIGKILGHYAVSTLLGKGGMGDVYKAKDQKLGNQPHQPPIDNPLRTSGRAKALENLIIEGFNSHFWKSLLNKNNWR